MNDGLDQLKEKLTRLRDAVRQLNTPFSDKTSQDLSAVLFHLSRNPSDPPVMAVVGGTGTGKSTLVNRLVGTDVSATSYRRTFTAGPIAIGHDALPSEFGGLIHVPAPETPAQGRPDRITFIPAPPSFHHRLILIDTPDIDGELAEHHAVTDRIFRWVDGVIFLVSPEKYQMPELQPYYRLATRYGMGTWFVMNKADNPSVVEDYRQLLSREGISQAPVFALPRDDSTWQPLSDQAFSIACLLSFRIQTSVSVHQTRIVDMFGRIQDQFLNPLTDRRQRIDQVIRNIRSMGYSTVDVDVHPVTRQLQRRMREKSVLYLMGPQRVLDRVRSVPALLVRLPKSMWNWTKTGELKLPDVVLHSSQDSLPDFRAIVVEQYQAFQSRIDDLLRSYTFLQSPEWKIPPEQAGRIVEQELNDLQQWLETKWNATPRDTAVLNKILKIIPGGNKVTRYSEAAPYLLTGYLTMSGAIFGHLDLLALAGYSGVVTLFHRLSDEVASRTRQTNRHITRRYSALIHQQIQQVIDWLDRQAPSRAELDKIEDLLDQVRSDVPHSLNRSISTRGT